MTLYTQAQVRDFAIRGGFTALGTPSQAQIASAIALVESSEVVDGMPFADSAKIGDLDRMDEKWGPSIGLMQVRSLKSQTGTGGPRDVERLPDPVFNLQSAHTIYSVYGWGAWSTYNSGAYRAFLQEVYPPKPGTYIVVAGDTLTEIAETLNLDWHVLASLNGLLPPYLLRIGQVLRLPYLTYTVVSGDTLSNIAKRFGVVGGYLKLAEINHLTSPYTIYPQQTLTIPAV